MNYITLYNVIDIRTGKFHSVAVVSENKVKFFKQANPEA